MRKAGKIFMVQGACIGMWHVGILSLDYFNLAAPSLGISILTGVIWWIIGGIIVLTSD
jgi:hypothetical protein